MPRVKAPGSDKPKGRMTAYAFFVQTCRDEHKKLHPDENVQFTEFSRQCSERWKTMSDKEKNKFHEMAETDKARHTKEMANWTPPPGETLTKTGRRQRRPRGAKKEKDPNKPKRALSAFFYYANDERPKVRAANPDFSVGEVAKELGRQWNELSATEKAPFEKSAEEDRARYDAAMKAYKAGEPPMKKQNTASTNGHKAPAPKVVETVESDEEPEEDDDEVDEDDDDDDEEEDESDDE